MIWIPLTVTGKLSSSKSHGHHLRTTFSHDTSMKFFINTKETPNTSDSDLITSETINILHQLPAENEEDMKNKNDDKSSMLQNHHSEETKEVMNTTHLTNINALVSTTNDVQIHYVTVNHNSSDEDEYEINNDTIQENFENYV